MKIITWIAIKTAKYEEYPAFNKWLAGIHAYLWAIACGYDNKHALTLLKIYWKPRLENPNGVK